MALTNIPSTQSIINEEIVSSTMKDLKPIYPQLYDVQSTTDRYKQFRFMGGLYHTAVKEEGVNGASDRIMEGKSVGVTQSAKYLQVEVSKETLKFDKKGLVKPMIGRELTMAAMSGKDSLLTDPIDNMFNTDVLSCYDSKAPCTTDHDLQYGNTFRNELTTGTSLLESSLETAVIDIQNESKNFRGKLIEEVNPQKLVINPALQFEARRILKNSDRPATADRDINALNQTNAIPEIVVHRKTSDVNDWLIKVDIPDPCLVLLESQQPMLDDDVNKQALTHSMSIHYFDGYNIVHPMGFFGSEVS